MRELYTVVFKEEVDIDDEEAWKGKLQKYKEDQELLIQNAMGLPGGKINTIAKDLNEPELDFMGV
jgi:hypothetical protein